jgi:Chemotaxis signal transduction protein
VDTVEEVLTVSDDQIEEAPGADSTMIESIIRIDERLIVLLTLSTIFEATTELRPPPELSQRTDVEQIK